MRKEVLIAVVFGLLLAFIITVAVNRASQAFRRQPATDPIVTNSPNPTGGVDLSGTSLTLHSPEDGLVQEETTLVVTGSTEPNRPVVLLTNEVESISSSDADGNFSFTTELKPGGNILLLYVLRDDGSSLTEQRSVIVGNFAVQNGQNGTNE